MYTFNDIAIPISWPDKTALGDEKWMAFLKQIGIVKNLHFKVGHAAILLIERNSGRVLYFDFGRYLSPRGYGRARSALFDPRLEISTKAQITPQGEIQNVIEILEELCEKEEATHGGGRTFFSICKQVSFSKCVAYAEKLVAEGPILYGALAKGNNSCSRFVAQILAEGMDLDDKRRRKILYPECLKASPTSNVVNAAPNEEVFCYEQGLLKPWKMGRKDSLLFQFGLLKDNFTKKGSQDLACDQTPGMIDAPLRPSNVPEHAQWIGGIGEGAWLQLKQQQDENIFVICKYAASGKLEYEIQTTCIQNFDIKRPYTFTPNFLYHSYSIVQDDNLYLFLATTTIDNVDNNQENIKAIL
ncbi:DUF6695 family protein [Sphingobacterium chuzhouense]|uniref:Uncharacterized protein n=1 Tax=Sphingobacterium chuzhouense TaxID=1742264 RepID=A0ABR7XLB7_9SPHI|nr:DUF6695 family protein [Sphingobacterium chuzhouense]MBD1419967.1 hypothetical protein [Sphingobacterium chuzhouense]